MNVLKYKFGITVLFVILLAGGGTIGYKFYQDAKTVAINEEIELAVKEAIEREWSNAELKVKSAEINPIQENVDGAEEAVNLLPGSEEKQELLERIVIVKEEIDRNQMLEEETRLAALSDKIDQAKKNLGISGSPSESTVLELLHKMTHQKVRSLEKWGFIQMTEVNLLAVKKVLQENPSYNMSGVMLTMVNNWLNGEFHNIADEHNRI